MRYLWGLESAVEGGADVLWMRGRLWCHGNCPLETYLKAAASAADPKSGLVFSLVSGGPRELSCNRG
eukprot:5216001-Pyramimonas_sp.AAC.1